MAIRPSSAASKFKGFLLYGFIARVLWATVFCVALLFELIPNPGVAPTIFYAIVAVKLTVIFLLGFFAPLTFWRFDSLTLGALLAVSSTAIAEALQSFVQGHKSSWFEFGIKTFLIFGGFALALNVRHDKRIAIGKFSVYLREPSGVISKD